MKRFLLLLLLLAFATAANAQTFHVIPLKGVNVDMNSNWSTKVGGYINTGSSGGNIDTSGTGGYIHTIDSGGQITTSHHGGYIATSYGGGIITTTGTGGGINTSYFGGGVSTTNYGGGINTYSHGGEIDTYNYGGTIDTSNSGAGIRTNGYTPTLGMGLIFNGYQFTPATIPTYTPPTSSIVSTGSTENFVTPASKIVFDNITKDTNGWWDATNQRFVPSAGYYRIELNIVGDNLTKIITIKKNGSAYYVTTTTGVYESSHKTITFATYANGTDYFDAWISSGSTFVYSGDFTSTLGTYLMITPLL